jgi:hypothetical protein
MRPHLAAHATQRRGDPLHRPSHQRCVANQHRIERLPGKQAGEEPHRRARIAEFERCARRREALESHAVDPQRPGSQAFDADAELGKRRKRHEAVIGLEVTAYLRIARCNRRQHRDPMRNRLVAWNADLAGHAAAGTRDEFPQVGAHRALASACAIDESSRSFCADVPVVMRR